MTYDPTRTDDELVRKWLTASPPWPASGTPGLCNDCKQPTWIELGGGPALDTYHPNIDVRKLPGVDIILDFEKNNLPFHDNHADRIKMMHVVNHLKAVTAEKILIDCKRVLKPGGSLFIMVTDIEFTCKRILEDGPRDCWMTCLYGTRGNTYDSDFHYWGYTPDSLSRLLLDLGYSRVMFCGHNNPWEFKIEAVK